MIDREYFEKVLPHQVSLIGRPTTLVLHVDTGLRYEVASLVAAHDSYVVLEVHSGDGVGSERVDEWPNGREGPPGRRIFDQVAVPYDAITATHLSPRKEDR